MNKLIYALPLWIHRVIHRLTGYWLYWNWDTNFEPREYFWAKHYPLP